MKKIVLFLFVSVIILAAGFGAGLVFGRNAVGGKDNAQAIPEPGPILRLGEFTSNLAGGGGHVVSFIVSLEMANDKALQMVSAAGWLVRVKNEVLLIVKDRVYEDLTSAEGALQFAEDIKRVLNAQLPTVRGDAPVVRVLFESLVLQ